MTDHTLKPAADADVRHFAFLAAAGEVLSSSLDYEQTLQHVARLAVPMLGDLCIVDIVADGQLRRLATAHVDADKATLLHELQLRYPPGQNSPQPAGRVVRSGEPELLEVVTPEVVASHTRDPQHAALILAIGIRSHLAIPLVARGATIGVISVGITESGRRYGPADVALVQGLARQAALAVDNARLYRAAHEELGERRRVEDALRLSEGRFRALMEQSPLSTQIFDLSGVPIRTNPAWETLWGVTLSDIPEYNILADPQLDVLGIGPLVRRAFAGETVNIPAVRYDPNETLADRSRHTDPVRWVRGMAYPIKDASGAVREVVLVHEDVTAAHKAEEQVRASEERLRRALTVGLMNVWDWDLASDRVECSENAREFWGIDVGQAADFMALIHPDDKEAVWQSGQTALAGDSGEYLSEYRLVDSERRVVRHVQSRGRVERDPRGRPRRILGVTVDITGLKTAQEATRLLADAGETLGASLDYRETLQSLVEVVVPRLADWCALDLVSEAGTLQRLAVNHPDPARVKLATGLFTRYPPRPSDAFGVWRVLATGRPEWASEITEQMLTSVAHDSEHLAVLRALGLRSYVCVPLVARGVPMGVLTLVYAESGRHFSAADVALATDLARRAAAAVDNARLYEQLRLEDRRKDEFLATLAHELRNPLAPIRTGLALLRVSSDGNATEKTLQVLDRQVSHMVRLIDDLLDLSRVTRGKVQLDRQRVDLWSVVGGALETSRPLIDAAGLQLIVRLPPEPVVLHADRTRLAQVLSNLLNNAAKYTERGGRVELEASVEGEELLVRVRDTGIGIPTEMLAHIFEMFAQVGRSLNRSQGGLGIGLTLVQRLVELHGGRVWAESDGLGTGSTFVIRLPIAFSDAARADTAPERPALTTAAHARRVLVVDDNVDAAETLAALLELDGHEVRTATDAPGALTLLADFSPQVAFLDIGLPGMNGYELARRMRELPHLSATTIVAVTGWGQQEDRRQSKQAGFDHHLTKPVDPRDVQALVAQLPSH